MEGVVEICAETINHFTGKPVFDQGYDKYTKWVGGKRVEQTCTPYRPSSRDNTAVSRAAPRTVATSPAAASSRRSRNTRRSLEGIGVDRSWAYQVPLNDLRDTTETATEISDRQTRKAYECESDDPVRRPESVLQKAQLRRDSRMASGYDDTAYRARSSGPTRTRYEDDESDYDEHTGRRYARGSGRGYDDRDDRDYEVVREETERYRGPPVDRSYDPARRESTRSGYGEGAVAQSARRSGDDLRVDDRRVSRRSKSRGRDREDRDYSRSRSRSREGIKEKLEEHFDTSTRGLGASIAGAVVGGLAGREFGNKHKQRDIVLGAIVGGLGANLAENKYREWREDKREKLDREEDRWDQKWEGRSHSNGR